MLKTLKFPLQIDPLTGSLAVLQGVEAAAQTLQAWGLAESGTYLYYGEYGASLQYNIPRGMAEAQALDLRNKVLADHGWLDDAKVRLIPDEDTRTVRMVLSFKVDQDSGLVGVEVGG